MLTKRSPNFNLSGCRSSCRSENKECVSKLEEEEKSKLQAKQEVEASHQADLAQQKALQQRESQAAPIAAAQRQRAEDAARGAVSAQRIGGQNNSAKVHDPALMSHPCIAISEKSANFGFGAVKNTCAYPINFTYCITGSTENSAKDCSGKLTIQPLQPGEKVGAEVDRGGRVFMFACKSPSTPTDVTFSRNGGIQAICPTEQDRFRGCRVNLSLVNEWNKLTRQIPGHESDTLDDFYVFYYNSRFITAASGQVSSTLEFVVRRLQETKDFARDHPRSADPRSYAAQYVLSAFEIEFYTCLKQKGFK